MQITPLMIPDTVEVHSKSKKENSLITDIVEEAEINVELKLQYPLTNPSTDSLVIHITQKSWQMMIQEKCIAELRSSLVLPWLSFILFFFL